MPSSSTTAAVSSRYLLDLLAQVPDPRKRRGRRHSLASLLAVGIAAVIAGSRSFAAIGQWAADAGPEVLTVLGAPRGAADESTFRRAFALVSGDVLDRVLGAWLWTRAVRSTGRLVIAVDGKAVRGARNKDGKAPHLVAALAHGIGAVLGQVAVAEKSNEIPAVRELLKAFTDLAGAVLTLDALHTQHDTAQAVLGRGADYVMTVKANMPTLYKQLKKLPWAAIPSVLLALALACRGQATVERVLNVGCALGSLTMNLLAANLTSPRSVTVWVLPSALYALTSDRLIAVMRRWVQSTAPETSLIMNGSAWHVFGGLTLWCLRLIFDVPGTLKGFRRWVLATAPLAPGVRAKLPQAPTRNARTDKAPTPGETKREALIRLYERCGEKGDPRYGDRAKAAAVAGEIANQIGYHPGTARRELARYLAGRLEASTVTQPETVLDAGEVAS